MKNRIAVFVFVLCGAIVWLGTTYLQYRDSIANLRVGKLTVDETIVSTNATQTLTTGSLVVDASAGRWITLTATSTFTGITLTGGTLGSEVILSTGAGSDSIRFDDDGTDLALGANITLTEGTNDVLMLMCTNSAGTTWQRLSEAQN